MRERKFCLRMLSLTLTLTMAAGQSLAQTSDSNLRVMVLDPNGAAINKARVSLKAGSKDRVAETNQHGEASFSRLPAGQYQIHVEAPGFKPRDLVGVSVPLNGNQLEVRLEVAPVTEQIVVAQDKREAATDPRGNAFTNVLTAAQIALLPDDPDEFEQAIRMLAPPGAMMRVNGFMGGHLPPKSQIREIRFRMDPYAAEFHNAGFGSIDIFTKPGVNQWHGSFNFGFRDESLNARQAFAPFRAAEQFRRFAATLDGPIWRDHTSLFLSADGNNTYDSKTILAALPTGSFFNDVIRRPSRQLNLQARVEHALNKTHTLRGEYQRNGRRQDNLGVGDFDLSERAFFTDQAEHIFRVSDSGALGKRLFNEFRFQTRWQEINSQALTQTPAILVLNAFNRGGSQVSSDRHARDFELADNVDFPVGKHALRFGLQFEVGNYHSQALSNANGTFTFSSLAAFQAGRPTTYTQRTGDPFIALSQYQFGGYLQDDIRVKKSLSVSLGLRHEWQTNFDDHNNVAARFGLAWSPFKDGKTTIRAGAGIFYNWLGADTVEQTLIVDGKRQRDLVVTNPGFPNPLSGGLQTVLPTSRLQLDPTLSQPYIEQVSVGVERQFSPMIRLNANYFYVRGVHLLRGRNINAPLPGLGRPDPTTGNITQVESSASSTQHLVNVGFHLNQPKRRLFFAVNYSLSKAANEADGPFSLPVDNFNLRAERGPAAMDMRHRFFVLTNMNLFKGLRLGTAFQATSALPYNITTGSDNNGDTVSNDRPVGIERNSARGAGRWEMSTRLSWGFGFGQPPESTGHVGARVVAIQMDGGNNPLGSMPSMPGANNKRYRMEFYVQAFNLFNHANLTSFSGVQTSPFFGHATAAMPGRRIESGLRFSF